jgi:methanogenic corrinoid protein MtbC1
MMKVARNYGECATASPSGVELSPPSGEAVLSTGPTSPESQDVLGSSSKVELLATIHEKIIPQLILAHINPAELDSCPNTRLPPTPEEVAEFSQIAVDNDLQAALLFIESMADDGLSVDVILLDLVAPAARLLGDEWLDDRRDFTEVTLGLNLLHRVVHVLGPSVVPSSSDRGSVVLVAAPAEQHTLGIFLLAEFLRKDGWGVQVDPDMPREDLLGLVGREHVDMVGISVSNSDLIGPLTELVSDVRSASINDDMAVMIGGSLSLASEAREIGATFCNDAREAVVLLSKHARLRRP